MRSIAILVPTLPPGKALMRSKEVFGQLEAPLRARGFNVEARVWSEPGALEEFDLVLPLLAWGYHRNIGLWRTLVRSWIDAAVPFRNTGPLLLWNSDKLYLNELAAKGVPVLPTRFVETVTTEGLESIAETFDTNRLIVKPRFSASAWKTVIWSPGTGTADGPDGLAIVQPFVESVKDEGEVSLIFIGGELSHSIRKLPQAGDFRVQAEHGGTAALHEPAPDEFDAARAALAVAGDSILYARCDILRREGKAEILELELIEPDLHLGVSLARERLAEAVAAACDQRITASQS